MGLLLPMLCTFWGRKANLGPFPGPQLPQAYWGVHPSVGRPVSPVGSDSRLFFSLKKTPLRSLIFKDLRALPLLRCFICRWLPPGLSPPPAISRLSPTAWKRSAGGGKLSPRGTARSRRGLSLTRLICMIITFSAGTTFPGVHRGPPPALLAARRSGACPFLPPPAPGEGRAGPRHELLGAVPAVGAAGQDLPRRAVPGGCPRYRPGSSWGIAPRPLGCGGAV